MKKIFFTPQGFQTGHAYVAQLLLNGVIVASINNLVNNVQRYFEVVIPGNYVLKIIDTVDGNCVSSSSVQALFPVVTHVDSSVDCQNNTYTFSITLTNPSTSGSNVRYGWSTTDNCSIVNNWQSSGNLILPADSTTRYVFVKNDDSACCNKIAQSLKNPCIICSLTVTGISFNCNG